MLKEITGRNRLHPAVNPPPAMDFSRFFPEELHVNTCVNTGHGSHAAQRELARHTADGLRSETQTHHTAAASWSITSAVLGRIPSSPRYLSSASCYALRFLYPPCSGPLAQLQYLHEGTRVNHGGNSSCVHTSSCSGQKPKVDSELHSGQGSSA